MIKIYYTTFNEQLPTSLWQTYLNILPSPLQEKVCRYRRWEDQHCSLFSRLLLRHALSQAGYNTNSLNQLQYNQYHRPYLDHPIDFNISHSGEYVICAISPQGRLGIDIEQIRSIKLTDFEKYMTPQQWQDITTSANPRDKFFDYWTIKEGVMKADGRGFHLPLLDIHTQGNQATVNNTTWYLTKISLDPNYPCHLVTDTENPTIDLNPMNFGAQSAMALSLCASAL